MKGKLLEKIYHIKGIFKKNFKKIGLKIVYTLLILIFWQFFSYYLYAGFARIMTINYFGPGLIGNTYYKFVCISDYKCRETDDYQKFCIRLAMLPTFRKVYFGRDNVPEDLKHQSIDKKTGEIHFMEFKNGYLLDLSDIDTGYMWYRSLYFNQTGFLGGEGREAVFIWVLGGWWPYNSHVKFRM
jgi:hypothetical protein